MIKYEKVSSFRTIVPLYFTTVQFTAALPAENQRKLKLKGALVKNELLRNLTKAF